MANDDVITTDQLIEHWQGHRRVTRRMIDAFPEKELFEFSVGDMRPFATLAGEMLRMAVPIARGVATGAWTGDEEEPKTKAELLRMWDESTEELTRVWKTIPPHRFQEEDTAFGQWKGTGIWMILYAIDNEIHHRGQGYVYLRALGIEPPAFYDRS
ncbi:MAG TPA: DinB family protein [Gemmatimonadaceae bacterium]